MNCWKSYCVLPANGFARLFFAQITCQICGREGVQLRGWGFSSENAPAKHVRYMRTCYFLPSWGPSEFWQLVIGSSLAVRCLFPNPSPYLSLSLQASQKRIESIAYTPHVPAREGERGATVRLGQNILARKYFAYFRCT